MPILATKASTMLLTTKINTISLKDRTGYTLCNIHTQSMAQCRAHQRLSGSDQTIVKVGEDAVRPGHVEVIHSRRRIGRLRVDGAVPCPSETQWKRSYTRKG